MNCLRRPFQGRALPVSYLGTAKLIKIVRKNRRAAKKKASDEIFTHRRKASSNSSYFMDSSNSRIQSFFFSTSRGFDPSGGPTIPSFSIKSMSRAARP